MILSPLSPLARRDGASALPPYDALLSGADVFLPFEPGFGLSVPNAGSDSGVVSAEFTAGSVVTDVGHGAQMASNGKRLVFPSEYLGVNALSIAFQVRLDSTAGGGGVSVICANGSFLFGIHETQKGWWVQQASGSWLVVAQGSVDVGQVYDVGLRRSGDTMWLYVDGILVWTGVVGAAAVGTYAFEFFGDESGNDAHMTLWSLALYRSDIGETAMLQLIAACRAHGTSAPYGKPALLRASELFLPFDVASNVVGSGTAPNEGTLVSEPQAVFTSGAALLADGIGNGIQLASLNAVLAFLTEYFGTGAFTVGALFRLTSSTSGVMHLFNNGSFGLGVRGTDMSFWIQNQGASAGATPYVYGIDAGNIAVGTRYSVIVRRSASGDIWLYKNASQVYAGTAGGTTAGTLGTPTAGTSPLVLFNRASDYATDMLADIHAFFATRAFLDEVLVQSLHDSMVRQAGVQVG